MNSIKINIPSDANMLIHTLQNAGYEAYVVGGCVRDSVLNRPVHDWDICTSATPKEMLEIFKDKKIIETGLKHGTVIVVVHGEPYEITTYRIDGEYSDGRRPDSVKFTTSLLEDLRRRDFTINAMAYNDKDGLIDPFNGMSDLELKLIRCVGSTEDRLNEDALRTLRALRFSCQLEFDITNEIKHHVNYNYELKEKLLSVSMERINNEFCKMITEKRFATVLKNNRHAFATFIPELTDIDGFQQNNPYHVWDVFMHTVYALAFCDTNDLITKLTIFFHDFGKPFTYEEDEDGIGHFRGHGDVSAEITNYIMRRMRFDNDTREKVVELVKYHDATFEVSKKCIKRWLNRIGEEQFKRLLEIRRADVAAQNPEYLKARLKKVDNMESLLNNVLEEDSCFSLKDLAVNGYDLIEIGFKPGKELGSILNMLLNGVVDEVYKNEKEMLLKEAKRLL